MPKVVLFLASSAVLAKNIMQYNLQIGKKPNTYSA